MQAEVEVVPAADPSCVQRHPGEPCPGVPHQYDSPTYTVQTGDDDMIVTCDECGQRASAPSVHDRRHHRKAKP